jgi:uncharacterized protein YdbL (DUF1318 family)
MKRVFIAILMTFALQTAWAIDIDTAKSQGLVGESNGGYLAVVKPPASADVQALIDTVNAKRRTAWQKIADSTSATFEQVRVLFYERAIQNTKPGHYYQDASGAWKKK